MIPQPNY